MIKVVSLSFNFDAVLKKLFEILEKAVYTGIWKKIEDTPVVSEMVACKQLSIQNGAQSRFRDILMTLF